MTDEYVTKTRRVRAIRFGGGEQGHEAVRWLSKWDIEAEYFDTNPREKAFSNTLFIYGDNGQRAVVVSPHTWIVVNVRTGDYELVSDRKFLAGYEAAS